METANTTADSVQQPEITPPLPPQVRCFKKVLFNLPFYVDGKAVAFTPLDQNYGVLEIAPDTPDNARIVEALTRAADARKGGIVAVTKEQLEGLKKKLPLKPSASKRKNTLAVWQRPGLKPNRPEMRGGRGASVAAGGETASTGGVGSRPVVGGGTVAAGPAAVLTPALARKGGGPTLRVPQIAKLQGAA